MAIIRVLQLVYLLLITPLAIYALSNFYIIFLYFRTRRRAAPPAAPTSWPRVTVQLPLYNERYVACRALEAIAALDYPTDRLHIQVLDDSTDDTTLLIQGWISQLNARGVHIDLIHRNNRAGYKSGALANALKYTDGEFIAIFDADFVPPPDFLRRLIPYFSDERIGVVQSRWGHLNPDDNLLTRAQALMLDGHFAVEQHARAAHNLIFSFNGTGGIWRRTCIESAGGWQHDTLTEDADLSYRAHLAGWKFAYVPDVVVPGEVSPQMSGFKQQQARWATGTTQVLLKMAGPVWRSQFNLRKRLIGIIQLMAYPIQPLSLAMFLLTPILIATDALKHMPLTLLGIFGLAAPTLYAVGQYALHRRTWPERALFFPVLMLFSIGLSISVSDAVFAALRGAGGEFKRTPKFKRESGKRAESTEWRKSLYAHLSDKYTPWELAFGLYALFGVLIARQASPSMIPYFLVYAAGFFGVALWSLLDYWLADKSTARLAQRTPHAAGDD